MKKTLVLALLLVTGIALAQQNPPEGWDSPDMNTPRLLVDNGQLCGTINTNDDIIWPWPCPVYKHGVRDLYVAPYDERNWSWNVLCYFEHVLTGKVADVFGPDSQLNGRGRFSPIQDPCQLTVNSSTSVTLYWPARTAKWPLECWMKYRFVKNAIDMEFTVKQVGDIPNLGYLAFMFASYVQAMGGDRSLYFYGINNKRQIGWQRFGDWEPGGRCMGGIIPCWGVKALPYESAVPYDVAETELGFKFLSPYYYGICDGDGDKSTTGDKVAYVMMFDRMPETRFVMWNWSGNGDLPAWDWEWVMRGPKVGKYETYKARVLFKPYTTISSLRQDLPCEYIRWCSGR